MGRVSEGKEVKMKRYIIVGGGVLGASTAYHLAKMGVDQVTIIDRKDKGQATDAAAGMICPWLSQRRNQAWYTLAKKGAEYFPKLINQLQSDGKADTGYKQVGAIRIHKDIEKLKKLEAIAKQRREEAPEIGEVSILTIEESKRLFPLLEEGYQSVFISGAARVNGRALRDALLLSAVKHGAKMVNGSAEIVVDGKEVRGVRVNGEMIEADCVIVTAGAWADELLAPLGIQLLLTYQKGQIVHLKLKNANTGEWPVIMPPGDQSILSFDNGEVVIGATHENNTGFDLRVTAGGLNEIFTKAFAVAPGLSDAEVHDIRVGFRPFTPNFLPVIGGVPGYHGLYLANGLGASGLTTAPFLGKQLAKLAVGEEIEIDMLDYDIRGAVNGFA